jgi:hypothetical protein
MFKRALFFVYLLILIYIYPPTLIHPHSRPHTDPHPHSRPHTDPHFHPSIKTVLPSNKNLCLERADLHFY